jgi:molecular chaperone HscB
MICWSCERSTDAAASASCSHCGAIQPPDRGTDLFAVLGLPRRFGLDLAAAEAAFKERSRQLHPDRFAKADPRARRASLGRTVQLNEAWRTVRDPVRRAEYLLALGGYVIGAEEGASRPADAHETDTAGAGATAGRVRIGAPPALLMEILELREELGEAREAGDSGRVAALFEGVRQRSDAALARGAAALETAGADDVPAGARAAARESAARELMALRYFRRFLDEQRRDGDDASPAEVPHA